MNKIVELVINLEEFEFEDLGVEILSLVDRPAIEVEWMAFSEECEECDQFLEDNPCTPGYVAYGMKPKNGRMVPNCVPVENSAQFASYSDYPDSVKNNAKRGIELNEKVNNKCATQVGKVRAQQLAKGEAVSEETIKRMKSYLSRAAVYYEAGDTESCGYISYLLWGGKSALTWAESKLNEIERERMQQFQDNVLDVAKEVGQVIDPTQVVYVDGSKETFATVEDILQGIRALDILEGLSDEARSQQAKTVYRYAGPAGQRTFCATLKSLNKVYTREEIARMNFFNPGFGINGAASYSVFEYKSGPNCRHYWEELAMYEDNGREVLVSLGPARGNAGKTNNEASPSPTGAVENNAYFSNQWSFSDDDEMIVTGPAMTANKLIPRKDDMGNLFHVYFSEETIEKIARKFLADNNTHNTDINHNGKVVTDNTLLESWIVKDPGMDKAKSLGFNPGKGDWYVSYKINDKETWNKIKAGELNGFSVEGSFLEIAQG